MENIYLDNNATTKVDDRVFAAMRPYLTNHFGHPSSRHLLGTKVREKVEGARDLVAVLLGNSHPDEIVFTSGGTESINTAIRGVLAAAPSRRGGGPIVVEIRKGVFSRYAKKESGSWQESDRGGTRLWGRVHNLSAKWKVFWDLIG